MEPTKKLEPFTAAKKFIAKRFPDCQGAVLAGSIVRGEETVTSDLDIVIFDKSIPSSIRSHSLILAGQLRSSYIT